MSTSSARSHLEEAVDVDDRPHFRMDRRNVERQGDENEENVQQQAWCSLHRWFHGAGHDADDRTVRDGGTFRDDDM